MTIVCIVEVLLGCPLPGHDVSAHGTAVQELWATVYNLVHKISHLANNAASLSLIMQGEKVTQMKCNELGTQHKYNPHGN